MTIRDKKGRFVKGFSGSPKTEFKKGHRLSEATKQKMKGRIPWNKGKGDYMKGKNNPFYGKTHSDKTKEINKIKHWKTGRFAYRELAFKNLPNKCMLCDTTHKLVVHHLDENKHNNRIENLVIMCYSCHNTLHKRNRK